MNSLLMRRILIFLLVSQFILIPFTSGAQSVKKPGLRIKATVKGVKKFNEFRIHPDNYLWTTKWDQSGLVPKITNVIYNINSGQSMDLPDVRTLLPQPETPAYDKSKALEYRTEMARLKLSGKFWKFSGDINGSLVYYNPKSDTAGLIYEFIHYKKSVSGNPKCAGKNESRFVGKYQSYYCDDQKEYLPEQNYISAILTREYLTLDIQNKKIISRTTLPADEPPDGSKEDYLFQPLGCDLDGRVFYYFYVTTRKSHNIYLRGVNLQDGKFLIKKEIPLPDRKNTEKSMNIYAFRSPDFSKVIFWEYDELMDENAGKLVNPGPLLFVVDLETAENFSLPGLLTMYGHAMDIKGKYLVLNSHQTGELLKYDLERRKPVLKMNVSKNIFKWVFDSNSGYLYGFTMNQIEVRNFEDLKLLKTIRYESVFPGLKQVDRLISTEEVFETLDGSRLVIGILKPQDTYAASDQEDGFYVIETGE